MTQFEKGAAYYDLLYSTKNYLGETEYVSDLINKYQTPGKNILEMGCGTGTHAIFLAKKGFNLTGIDLSSEMIELAKAKLENHPKERDRIEFHQSEGSAFKIDKTFDTAISLFHVMGYFVENESLLCAFKNIHSHLANKGLFIFDTWYGPGVLTDLPKPTLRRFENENLKITRFSAPSLDVNSNTVDVRYDIFLEEKQKKSLLGSISEKHLVRFFFIKEMEHYLGQSGFELLSSQEWMTGKAPTKDTFGICFIARKIN